jgi:hypothetical protein
VSTKPKIESAIRACDFFVCLLARSTLKSAWVREEERLLDAEEVRLFTDYDEGTIDKLARIILAGRK